ncbi:MAG: folylpolyglutamate synthase/dihydrofolate synthase family protein [Sphaerochaetaceae bacterium]|jgi:dihydrofolate synthase/folylpolyglutamate synthase|nr:folylpolyglutamate synthase/dihydrofolate synthase family protein [Sphaerochaetaceae bacterium]
MKFTDFDQFCLYMESFTNLERQNSGYTVRLYRLDRMRALLGYIGNPERDFKTIHVAGSKGKGSTAVFLAKGLEALGYKTGLYTSPHLVNYRERFTLAGTFFPEEELVKVANLLVGRLEGFHFEDEWGSAAPTAFELYSAFAFLLFSSSGCTWAVIETGLGGRLDATNTIVPEASVITPIELEHTAILGNTIALIASEKAKIIKEGVPVFISRQKENARKVFVEEALNRDSRLYDLEATIESLATKTLPEGEQVVITWRSGEQTSLLLSMRGQVQAENCALALYVLRTLNLYKKEITEAALAQAKLAGRMEFLGKNPPLIIDGAHTVESLRHLLNSFVELYGTKGNTIIYGVLEDKDHIHMARLLLPLFDFVIVARPGTFKKSDPEKLFLLLQEELQEMRNPPQIFLEKDPDKALELAYSLTEKNHAILCTGSFYLGGEITLAYRKRIAHNVLEIAICP